MKNEWYFYQFDAERLHSTLLVNKDIIDYVSGSPFSARARNR